MKLEQTVIVEKGDTLSHIAERFLHNFARWPELARFNELPNPHLIIPGQRIKLPA